MRILLLLCCIGGLSLAADINNDSACVNQPPKAALRLLLPRRDPTKTYTVRFAGDYRLQVREFGPADGQPVLILQGGPGLWSSPLWEPQLFSPQKFRLIVVAQMGGGGSKPLGKMTNNTTRSHIEHLEAIREKLGIEQWIVSGGGSGGTFALAYGQAHPKRVTKFILRSPWLARLDDYAFRMVNLAKEKANAADWAELKKRIPELSPNNFYVQMLKWISERDKHFEASLVFLFRSLHARLAPTNQVAALLPKNRQEITTIEIAQTRVELYFYRNMFFLEENQLLRDLPKIAHLPAQIIHGELDQEVSPQSSRQLHALWPNSDLKVIPGAGHHISDPWIRDAMLRAAEAYEN